MDPSEFNLDKTSEPSPGLPQRQFPIPWLIGAVAILAAGVAIWFFLSGEPAPEPADDSPPVSEAPPAPPLSGPTGVCQPPGPSADGVADPGAAPIALPPLEASDTLVSMLAGTLSLNPQVAAWLATDDLIRTFTAVVENIASGASPAVHLGQLRPDSPFVVIPNGDGATLDPRSYSRYRPIVAAVQSIDVQAAAQLCATLKPRLDEAFAELGRNESFETALERAIVALLNTPALGENVQLVRNDDTYAFRDVELESLTPAQKHLARMGAENTRAIQAALRRLALAIGIPGDRLPQSPG